jgi:hypothetical protein
LDNHDLTVQALAVWVGAPAKAVKIKQLTGCCARGCKILPAGLLGVVVGCGARPAKTAANSAKFKKKFEPIHSFFGPGAVGLFCRSGAFDRRLTIERTSIHTQITAGRARAVAL